MSISNLEQTVKALKSGDRIMVTMPDPMRPADRIRYGLVSSGHTVSAITMRQIIDRLRPVNDGLFGDLAGGQTYEWDGA